MRIAVIDLGTNTFNLIIVERQGDILKTLYGNKISVKLGKGGIGNNLIMPDALDRAYNTLALYRKVMDEYNVDEVIALGTSALRTSDNAFEFKETVKQRFTIDIDIISGDEEAELIFYGVSRTYKNPDDAYLILDIGGGSNEFIIVKDNTIQWKQSYKLGMARLIERFSIIDKISESQVNELITYFNEELGSLFQACKSYKIKTLVGAEGSFETFYNMIGYFKDQQFIPDLDSDAKEIKMNDFKELSGILLRSTTRERLAMKGLEPYRVEMIVPAVVFVDNVMRKLRLGRLLASPFSMKEGAVFKKVLSK